MENYTQETGCQHRCGLMARRRGRDAEGGHHGGRRQAGRSTRRPRGLTTTCGEQSPRPPRSAGTSYPAAATGLRIRGRVRTRSESGRTRAKQGGGKPRRHRAGPATPDPRPTDPRGPIPGAAAGAAANHHATEVQQQPERVEKERGAPPPSPPRGLRPAAARGKETGWGRPTAGRWSRRPSRSCWGSDARA